MLQRLWRQAEEVPIPSGEGGHGGGDALMLRDIFRGAGDDPLGRAASYVDGMRSVIVGVAANRSLATGRAVAIDEFGLTLDA